MNRSFFDREQEQPVTLDASIYLTIFGNPRANTIPLQSIPVNTLDGLQCFVDMFNQLLCRSAFRWPARIVDSDTGSFGRVVSYSPFPAGLHLNPIETRGATSGPPVSARVVTITVREQLSHFQRDVEVRGDALRIGPHAVITGNLRYRVPAGKVRIDSAARISGTVTALPVSRGWSLTHWLWTLGFLVAGGLAVALLPGFTAEAAAIIPERPFRSALVGLGWFIILPIAITVAAITVIGLPLAIIAAVLWGILLYLGTVPFAIWVGRLLLGARTRAGRQGALLTFLLGGVLLLAVGVIPVVGPIVTAIAVCLGFGAIIIRTLALRRETQVA